MPDIHFECPKCSQTLDAPEELASKLIDCPTCKEAIEVPAPNQRIELPKPQEPTSKPPPSAPRGTDFKLPPIEGSITALVLSIIAAIDLVAAPFAGLIIGGTNNEQTGWEIFLGGTVAGLVLLGFARVIENTWQSAQRLARIEVLLQRGNGDEKGAIEDAKGTK
jgi:hypothetical protein